MRTKIRDSKGKFASKARYFVEGTKQCSDSDSSVKGSFVCRRCSGTGQFITHVLNGKPQGPGGICFRCEGKSFHTLEDRRRNASFDNHQSAA